MKIAMTIDECLEFADEWSKGLTLYEGAQGWRVVCMLLAEEVRRQQKETAEVKDVMHSLAGTLWRLDREGYIRDLDHGDEETAAEIAHLLSVGMPAVDAARKLLGEPKAQAHNAGIHRAAEGRPVE